MPKFIDQHGMGSLTPEILKEFQKQPRDELGVLHQEILYNKEENKVFYILDAQIKRQWRSTIREPALSLIG